MLACLTFRKRVCYVLCTFRCRCFFFFFFQLCRFLGVCVCSWHMHDHAQSCIKGSNPCLCRLIKAKMASLLSRWLLFLRVLHKCTRAFCRRLACASSLGCIGHGLERFFCGVAVTEIWEFVWRRTNEIVEKSARRDTTCCTATTMLEQSDRRNHGSMATWRVLNAPR